MFYKVLIFVMATGILSCAPRNEMSSNEEDISTVNSQETGTSSSINLSKFEISPLICGVNGANLFQEYSDNPQGREVLKELGAKVLRFPGGTVSSFYHIDGPGYGYLEKDLAHVKGNAKKNFENSLRKEQKSLQSKNINTNFIYEFVKVAKQNSASVLVVANLLTAQDEELFRIIEVFKENDVPIVGVELGNEYFFPAYESVFPNVDSYIKRAKKISLELKSRYPNIQIAVVAANLAGLKNVSSKRAQKYKNWNEKLGELDFYDAYIKHIYAKNKSCSDSENSFQCELQGNIKFCDNEVPAAFKKLEDYFGKKDIWLTEWNVKDVFKGLGNSHLQALYYAQFSMTMLNEPKVKIGVYHNLMGSGNGFNLITYKKGKCNKASAFHVFKMFSEIYEGGVRKIDLGMSKIDGMNILGFEKEDKSRLIYIINLENEEKKLEKIMDLNSNQIFHSSVISSNSGEGVESILKSPSANLNVKKLNSENWDARILPYSVNCIYSKSDG